MAVKVRLSLAVLISSLLALCVGIAIAKKDPELKVCKHQCKGQLQYDEREIEKCLRDCEEYIKRKKEQERETRGTEEEEDDEWMSSTVDPAKKKLRQCLEQCERQGGGEQKSLCRLRCQEKYEREPGREEEGNMKENEVEGNPYVFEDRHFKSTVETEHGRVRVLPKFTKKSELLRGIENIRVAILEANPQTFIAPVHLDAGYIFFVAKGRGAVTLICEEEKHTFNLEPGDFFRVPAGTTFYMVNKDEKEKLHVAEILWPINLPGKYKAFHAAGGEEAESFFRAFSWELLEAALKTDRGKLERIFKQQGRIVKASKEQIQALSRGEEGGHGGGGIWPFPTGGSIGPFNLFDKGPVKSNKHGQLFEAKPKDSELLRDLDFEISLANITRGSMAGPYYNSKATKISIVLEGEGYFEMACPHVSSSGSSKGYMEREGSRGRKGGRTYQRISSRLSRNTVFIVPAGHPVATVASENSDLKVLCFEVSAKGNIRFPLAGKWNVVGEMDREAKELAFGVPAREVEQIFESQKEEFFFPGPRGQPREGRAYA